MSRSTKHSYLSRLIAGLLLFVMFSMNITAISASTVANDVMINAQDKAKLIAEYQRGNADTGSPEVQIALLTQRINGLTFDLK